jgi:hypothetical protein
MFNLLVSGSGWADSRDTMPSGRIFEYTDPEIVSRYRPENQIDFRALIALPVLFLEEISPPLDQPARVGFINRARLSGGDVALEYTFEPAVPPLTNNQIRELAQELDIENFEFSRTHWAVKDVDLFHVLLRNAQPRRPAPRVFQLAEPENIEESLVSVMMPFHSSFDGVYAAIANATTAAGLRSRRADDIWENPAIIQDVVSLIDRARIVICDCTDRNPNVFYEIGIAHTLGREVILITQSDHDIPFDLRHLRYVQYLNNGEGLEMLSERLQSRMNDLVERI